MCFLSPTRVFRVTTLQVGQTASPRSWMARCHCSSGPPVEQGQGLRGRQELPDALDAKHRTQGPCSAPSPRLGTCPTLKTRPVPCPPAAPTWSWVGPWGRHLLADSAGGGWPPLPHLLRDRPLLLLGTVDAGFVLRLGQAYERTREGQVQAEGAAAACAWPHRCPAGPGLTFESESP